jgi:hypothetical protein
MASLNDSITTSTIGAIIGLLYFFFLVSGDTFLRKLVLVTPSLKDKKRAVQLCAI